MPTTMRNSPMNTIFIKDKTCLLLSKMILNKKNTTRIDRHAKKREDASEKKRKSDGGNEKSDERSVKNTSDRNELKSMWMKMLMNLRIKRKRRVAMKRNETNESDPPLPVDGAIEMNGITGMKKGRKGGSAIMIVGSIEMSGQGPKIEMKRNSYKQINLANRSLFKS